MLRIGRGQFSLPERGKIVCNEKNCLNLSEFVSTSPFVSTLLHVNDIEATYKSNILR